MASLTETQIQTLYKFTRMHYVEHYDLQTELVDHLANGIEQQWQKHPQRSFNEALDLEFKKFGVFGFHDVIAQRQNAMAKKYRNLLWRFAKEWFKWAKVFLTSAVTLLLFLALRFLNQTALKKDIVLGTLLFFSAAFLIYFFVTKKSRQASMARKGKRLMLAEMIYNFGGGVAFAYLPMNLVLLLNPSNENFYHSPYFDIVVAIGATLFLITMRVAFFVLPSKIEEVLKEVYPEYKMT